MMEKAGEIPEGAVFAPMGHPFVTVDGRLVTWQWRDGVAWSLLAGAGLEFCRS
jgi:hypothetical protein